MFRCLCHVLREGCKGCDWEWGEGRDERCGKRHGKRGMSYTMDYAFDKKKFEEEVSEHGVTVFVDPKAVMHILGTTMDFVVDDLTSEFVFHNPNATGSCGCGESFSVK